VCAGTRECAPFNDTRAFELAQLFGHHLLRCSRPFDAGPLANARYLEAMAMLWIDLALKRGRGPSFGFRTLERAAT
jgi:predicted dinucleotide-binding enzyme